MDSQTPISETQKSTPLSRSAAQYVEKQPTRFTAGQQLRQEANQFESPEDETQIVEVQPDATMEPQKEGIVGKATGAIGGLIAGVAQTAVSSGAALVSSTMSGSGPRAGQVQQAQPHSFDAIPDVHQEALDHRQGLTGMTQREHVQRANAGHDVVASFMHGWANGVDKVRGNSANQASQAGRKEIKREMLHKVRDVALGSTGHVKVPMPKAPKQYFITPAKPRLPGRGSKSSGVFAGMRIPSATRAGRRGGGGIGFAAVPRMPSRKSKSIGSHPRSSGGLFGAHHSTGRGPFSQPRARGKSMASLTGFTGYLTGRSKSRSRSSGGVFGFRLPRIPSGRSSRKTRGYGRARKSPRKWRF
jgi:hypothetical protein